MISMKIRTLTIAALSAVVALGLAGCASNPTVNDDAANGQQVQSADAQQTDASTDQAAAPARTPEEELADPADLTIADYGWFPAENGMVLRAVR